VNKMFVEELTDLERKKLLEASKKIYENKVMHTKAFGILTKKAKDQRMKQHLEKITSNEANHAEFWNERIVELGGKSQFGENSFLRDLRVGFMIRILGMKGFFEWGVEGESDGIEDLAIQVEKIRKEGPSRIWSRIACDERLHLESLKTEVLGMDAWEVHGGGGVRDMVFGASDGLVSTLAFVAGVVGATTDPSIVLLSGVAELLAGTISMAAGSYESAKSELEVLEKESRRKQVKACKTVGGEREELVRFYESEGFERGEAEAIADRVIKENEPPLQTEHLESLGLAPKELGSPLKAGALTGLFFCLAALVPIFAFTFPLDVFDALMISVIASVITLFGVGVLKTIFSRRNWFWSGLETMAIGAAAAGITYVIGSLFSGII
jgi:VIT1/CCC1 family predicted Fe2+/Mn2+ transporter